MLGTPITNTEDIEDQNITQKKLDKALIDHCEELFKAAQEMHPTKQFKKYEQYYLGKFDIIELGNLTNNLNIIKCIIETKTTLTLDSKVTTSVVPKIGSMADLNEAESINKIADIMNDCLDHVNYLNELNSIKEKVVRRALKVGSGIAKIVFNPDASNGIGDIEISEVNPMKFFPDPNSKNINDCNYIVELLDFSSIDLKKKFPDKADEIDSLVKNDSANGKGDGKAVIDAIPVMYKTDQSAGQTSKVGNASFSYLKNNIEVKMCYLKDDSTFVENPDDTTETNQEKQLLKFKYPHGRVITYAGEILFEDKPLDAPFGYPFEKMDLISTDSFWGHGDIQDLTEIQDRINRTFYKIRFLVGAYLSILMVDEGCGVKENSLINSFLLTLEPGYLGTNREPKVLTNNTLSELEALKNWLEYLKEQAKEVARVNDSMISGERQTGVNSGEMVEALMESPMTSIRQIQTNLNEFLVKVANKTIQLVQMTYNTPRILRIAQGKQFAQIMPGEQAQNGEMVAPGNIKIIGIDGQMLDEIKGDLSICDFECRIVAGAELPRNRGSLTKTYLQLYQMGLLGDPNSIETKKLLLNAMDIPDKRIIEQVLQNQMEQLNANPPIPTIDKISMAFKDLPPEAQVEVLQKNSLVQLPPENQPPIPIQQ